MRAVSLVYLSPPQNSPHLLHESGELYERSLGFLSRAICDLLSRLPSEALAATVLFSFSEIFSPNNEASERYNSWAHAGGPGAVMQLRRPRVHPHGLDRSIFLGNRMALIIHAFKDGRPCFSEDIECRKLCRQIHQEAQIVIIDRNEREILDIRDQRSETDQPYHRYSGTVQQFSSFQRYKARPSVPFDRTVPK